MGADEEVWEDSHPNATLPPVGLERLACKEQRFARNVRPADVHLLQQPINIFDALVSDRELGIDDR